MDSNVHQTVGRSSPVSEAGAALTRLAEDATLIPESLREWWTGYLTSHQPRYDGTLRVLEKELPRQGRLLEAGSVPGHFTVMLKAAGYDVTALDIDPSRLAAFWEKHGISVDAVDIEHEPLPYPDGAFHAVVFSEILEHLRINPLGHPPRAGPGDPS